MISATDALMQPVQFTIERWISVREALLPSIERLGGTYTETDVVAALMAGQMGLWIYRGSALVTNLNIYPRLKELNIFIAGGHMEDVMAFVPSLEAHAREIGCQRFKQDGRWGWRKWEKDYPGFRFHNVSLVKDL
jgi:hypothetical protein